MAPCSAINVLVMLNPACGVRGTRSAKRICICIRFCARVSRERVYGDTGRVFAMIRAALSAPTHWPALLLVAVCTLPVSCLDRTPSPPQMLVMASHPSVLHTHTAMLSTLGEVVEDGYDVCAASDNNGCARVLDELSGRPRYRNVIVLAPYTHRLGT